MRLVFLGTPALAVPSLAKLAEGHEVLAAVCQPDRAQGRSARPVPPPVKAWAESHGIPVHQPEKLNDGAFEAWLRGLKPDAGIVVAYGRLLKQPLLDVPPLGWLNLHPSLLPRWRGPSPIQSAILAGDTETGVSIMRLSLAMDAGDVILQEATAIAPDETAAELTERLANWGAALLADAAGQVASGTARYIPQRDADATFCGMIRKEDGRIRWTQGAQEVHNRVRGCVPWPVAHCLFRGEVCRIHRGLPVAERCGAEPGTITRVERDRVLVAAGEGQYAILEFQAPGKRALPMDEYLRGAAIREGERFEELPE